MPQRASASRAMPASASTSSTSSAAASSASSAEWSTSSPSVALGEDVGDEVGQRDAQVRVAEVDAERRAGRRVERRAGRAAGPRAPRRRPSLRSTTRPRLQELGDERRHGGARQPRVAAMSARDAGPAAAARRRRAHDCEPAATRWAPPSRATLSDPPIMCQVQSEEGAMKCCVLSRAPVGRPRAPGLVRRRRPGSTPAPAPGGTGSRRTLAAMPLRTAGGGRLALGAADRDRLAARLREAVRRARRSRAGCALAAVTVAVPADIDPTAVCVASRPGRRGVVRLRAAGAGRDRAGRAGLGRRPSRPRGRGTSPRSRRAGASSSWAPPARPGRRRVAAVRRRRRSRRRPTGPAPRVPPGSSQAAPTTSSRQRAATSAKRPGPVASRTSAQPSAASAVPARAGCSKANHGLVAPARGDAHGRRVDVGGHGDGDRGQRAARTRPAGAAHGLPQAGGEAVAVGRPQGEPAAAGGAQRHRCRVYGGSPSRPGAGAGVEPGRLRRTGAPVRRAAEPVLLTERRTPIAPSSDWT